MLATASIRGEIPAESCDSLHQALYDALCSYYPETGEPEEPERLPYVAIPDAQSLEPAGELKGYEAIKAAPSTNRDGGSGPGGGFAPPDKQLAAIEKILEDLADKGKGIEDRVTTADIIVGIIKAERPASDLKSYLLGK